nr:G5 domain-containing protein [uncultured Bacillus sp.]
MENTRDLKLILLMILCTGYFFSFSIVGEKTYNRVSANGEAFQEGTAIASVHVAGLTKNEALTKMQQEQAAWMEQTTINLQYKEKVQEFKKDSFIFSLEKSVNQAQPGENNQLYVDVEEEMISAALIDFAIAEENFDREAFIQELKSYPSMLEKGIHSIKLEDFLKEQPEKKVISEAVLPFKENTEQMDLWISQFPTVTIKPHSQFSILDSIEEKGIKTFTSEGLSIIATAIYQAVLPTNFSVTERSISRELPYYAQLGYEAKVDRNKNMDLIIANPNDYEYVLEFKQENSKLHVIVSGPPLLYQYRAVLPEKETFNPKNIVQFDAKLNWGEQKVKTQGKKGYLQKIYRETVDSSGAVISSELLSEDFYSPIHTVVLKSMKPEPPATDPKEEAVTEEETQAGDAKTNPAVDSAKAQDNQQKENADSANNDQTPKANESK